MNEDNQTTVKFVKIMPEYSSSGLWDHEGIMMDEDELPISPELQQRRERWCLWYEDSEFYMPKDQRKPFNLGGFVAEGLALAKAIKAEIPCWKVVYYDESRAYNEPSLDVTYEVHND